MTCIAPSIIRYISFIWRQWPVSLHKRTFDSIHITTELIRHALVPLSNHSMISSSLYAFTIIIILWYHYHSMISESVLRSFSHTDYDLGCAFIIVATLVLFINNHLLTRNRSSNNHMILDIPLLFWSQTYYYLHHNFCKCDDSMLPW